MHVSRYQEHRRSFHCHVRAITCNIVHERRHLDNARPGQEPHQSESNEGCTNFYPILPVVSVLRSDVLEPIAGHSGSKLFDENTALGHFSNVDIHCAHVRPPCCRMPLGACNRPGYIHMLCCLLADMQSTEISDLQSRAGQDDNSAAALEAARPDELYPNVKNPESFAIGKPQHTCSVASRRC